jgi:hypothetical protein
VEVQQFDRNLLGRPGEVSESTPLLIPLLPPPPSVQRPRPTAPMMLMMLLMITVTMGLAVCALKSVLDPRLLLLVESGSRYEVVTKSVRSSYRSSRGIRIAGA